VANSAALKISGIDASTADPAGGVIVRKKGQKNHRIIAGTCSRFVKKKGTEERNSQHLKNNWKHWMNNRHFMQVMELLPHRTAFWF